MVCCAIIARCWERQPFSWSFLVSTNQRDGQHHAPWFARSSRRENKNLWLFVFRNLERASHHKLHSTSNLLHKQKMICKHSAIACYIFPPTRGLSWNSGFPIRGRSLKSFDSATLKLWPIRIIRFSLPPHSFLLPLQIEDPKLWCMLPSLICYAALVSFLAWARMRWRG